MPLYKCSECHHEWEGSQGNCSWCKKGVGILLEEKTPLEESILKMLRTPGKFSIISKLLEIEGKPLKADLIPLSEGYDTLILEKTTTKEKDWCEPGNYTIQITGPNLPRDCEYRVTIEIIKERKNEKI